MAAFTVIIRRAAQRDIEAPVAWPGWRNAAGSNRWRTGLLAAVVGKLETDPGRYPQAVEAADLGVDLREMLYGRHQVYRVLFTIDGDTVNVLRVRHAAQDLLTDADL